MEIRHEIEIAAPATRVWAVTMDWPRWPEWTPTVSAVEVSDSDRPIGLGSSAVLTQPGLPPTPWTVTEFDPPHTFAWSAKVRGFRFVGAHHVEVRPSGARSTIRLEVGGAAGLLLGWTMRKRFQDALRRENEGLRDHCEALHRNS